jgi:hypothetical protein
MIRFGRYDKLQQFVLDALNENSQALGTAGAAVAKRTSGGKRRGATSASTAG